MESDTWMGLLGAGKDSVIGCGAFNTVYFI